MSDKEFDLASEHTMSLLAAMPEAQRARLLELLDETRNRYERILRAHRLAMDALDDWRLYIKYRIFDLEAQQRELDDEAAHDEELGDEESEC